MLTFDTLLVKELQKQQSRAEFCDIVLQSRGVSVPVHSCVLSAFSPWLCGALSAMPSPRNGQKRLIEVQAVESCTLLSLVSLLYSGQFKEDKEEVLSAACKLGINIPHREAKRPSNEQNTQTENTGVEKECQTEALPTAESIETAGPSLWRSDQGFCTYTDGTDITLTALQTDQGNPESMPSFQVMDVVPESALYPTVSGPACLPQVYVCPPAASYQQPATQVPSSSTHASHGESAVGFSGGEDCVLEAFTRFENNIPGFINYFLDANNSGQSQRGGIKSEGRARRARGRGGSGGLALKVEKFIVSKRQQNTNRCGRVARLALTGQGGGRVGGMLVNRQMFKNQGRRTRGAMKQEGERGRSSSRARQRRRGSRSVEPERQDAGVPKRRRGRPRKRPLPQSDASGNVQPVQKSVNPPAPSLMHTAALPAANQTMDWLIDDVISQLPLMPSNQQEITNSVDSNADQVKTQSAVKLTDFGIVHPQSEGELTDILDSFLRTFEQHVGACDSDVQDAVTPSVSDGQSTSYATSVNATTQKANNRPRATRRPQKPSTYWQLAGVKFKKSPRRQEGEMPARMTRSQSQKRKLEVIEELLRTDPSEQKKRKKERSEKPKDVPKEMERPTKKCKSSTFEHGGNKMKSSDQSEQFSRVKKKHTRTKTKPLPPQGSLMKIPRMDSQPKQPVVKNKTSRSQPALSAFDLVKQILENQQKREKEHNKHKMWTVKKQKGKDRLHACGADSEEKDDSVRVDGQKHEETRERRTEDGDQNTTCLQPPSDRERTVSDGERLMENSFRSETPDSAFQRCVIKNTTDVPLVSAAIYEKRSDTSDEDVDVVEVSSCLSEPAAVLPLSEIELSTDKEDSDEDHEIDVISVGSD